jgi:ABC-type transport system involved in cytochrome bd biosynthesis fused ATPase/permease subunit
VLPFGLTLGSIKIFQGTADQLSQTTRTLRRQLYRSFQAVFIVAAWLAFVEISDAIREEGASSVITSGNRPQQETEERPSRIDYEQTRTRRGMKIQAQNLTFKYPGESTPTLKNINLTIEPGESLAIVGYNGSGELIFLHRCTDPI